MRIVKGDKVIVLTGKDRGVESVVESTLPQQGKIIVEKVNVARRHTKPRSAEDPGGIIDKNMPIDVSNVAVISPKDGKATRVGYKLDNGKKVRICKRTGVELPEVK